MIFNVKTYDLETWTFQNRADGNNVVDLRGADKDDALAILATCQVESGYARVFVAVVDAGAELPYRLFPRVVFCIEVDGDGRDFFWLRDSVGRVGVLLPDGASGLDDVLRSADVLVGGARAAELARKMGVTYVESGIAI